MFGIAATWAVRCPRRREKSIEPYLLALARVGRGMRKQGGSASGAGRHRSRPARVGRGTWAASAEACCARRTWRLGIGQSEVGQRQAASAKACTHRTWHVRIVQATSANHTSQSRRRAWHARIARGFNGQPRSAVDCQHRPFDRTQRSADVGRPSPLDRTQRSPTWAARRPWTARNVQPTSAAGSPHGPWLARSGQPWTARIGRGLRDDGQPQRFRLTWFVRRNLVREEPLIQTIGHRA
ncbi:hypothetical protein KY289_015310 [Solanum tuberosum]|nr:hypothetical protein KY289_015310 [Solanum tuberosum]